MLVRAVRDKVQACPDLPHAALRSALASCPGRWPATVASQAWTVGRDGRSAQAGARRTARLKRADLSSTCYRRTVHELSRGRRTRRQMGMGRNQGHVKADRVRGAERSGAAGMKVQLCFPVRRADEGQQRRPAFSRPFRARRAQAASATTPGVGELPADGGAQGRHSLTACALIDQGEASPSRFRRAEWRRQESFGASGRSCTSDALTYWKKVSPIAEVAVATCRWARRRAARKDVEVELDRPHAGALTG